MTNALALSTSARSARWEDTYEQLAYTAFALATQARDPEIGRIFSRVRGVLADWETIEADRRTIRSDAIAARAAVRIADAALDITLAGLAEATLRETNDERDHALYQRFFPEPHERVIALGLDGELPIASVALAQLREDEKVPEALSNFAEQLEGCVAAGNQALAARAEAYAALGRLEARVEAWFETAVAIENETAREVRELGEAKGRSARWAQSFFLAP